MKFLIWFLCLLGYAVITTVAGTNGVTLGAIPTMLLFGGMLWLARTLCKAWDKRGDKSGVNSWDPDSGDAPPL